MHFFLSYMYEKLLYSIWIIIIIEKKNASEFKVFQFKIFV